MEVRIRWEEKKVLNGDTVKEAKEITVSVANGYIFDVEIIPEER